MGDEGGGEIGVAGTVLGLNFLTPSPPPPRSVRPQKGPGGDSSRKRARGEGKIERERGRERGGRWGEREGEREEEKERERERGRGEERGDERR